MAYSITTKDGITINNIPDDVPADSQTLKDRIASIRGGAKPKQSAPVEDPGLGMSMLIGAGRTFDRVGKGMQQLYYGATDQADKQAALQQQADDDDAAYKPLTKLRPFSTGMGEALPSMVVPGGGATTMLGNMGRMALAGGIPQLLEHGTAAERIKRGAIGAGSAAAVPLIGAAARSASSFAEPLYAAGRSRIAGRTLNRVAGDDAANVIQRLQNARPLVPGSMPTAAQVAENGGVAALERSAAAANPSDYTARFMGQASARLNALRSVAGDDATMAAAVRARDAASKSLYAAADAGVAPVDRFFKGLEMRPQFSKAVARAQELAKDKGLTDIFFRDKDGKPIALIGEGAHFIKKALDEAGEYGSTSYTGKTAANAANETNELFQNWLAKSIPEYAAGKAAFAAGSRPINQMQVGQALMEKASPALADYGALGRETGATFANALRRGDQVAATATGFSGSTMKDVLDPGQFRLVENIAKDLARKANAQDLGRGAGSDTFQKLSMSNIAEQSGMPKAVGGLLDLPVVSRATKWVYRDADEKMQKMLADIMLDPKKAADVMKGANSTILQNNPQLRQFLEQSVIRGGGLLGLTATPNP